MIKIQRPAMLRADCWRIEIAAVIRAGDGYRREWTNDREGWRAIVALTTDEPITVADMYCVLAERRGEPAGEGAASLRRCVPRFEVSGFCGWN